LEIQQRKNKMIEVSIIIPFLNEAENIPNLAQNLNLLSTNSKLKIELIFVDDGSVDNSNELLSKQKFSSCKTRVIKLSQNFGSHAALRAGILHATGKYMGFIYADLQDPIELIEDMYRIAVKEDKNIVWASRNNTRNSLLETFFSKGYAALMKKYAIKSFPVKGFDVVLFDHKVQQQLNKNIESNSSIFLQILIMGFNQTTIRYDKIERKIGKSKWTITKKIKLFIDSFVAFSYFPIRLVTVCGIIFLIAGVFWSLYIIFLKIFYNNLDPGWPTLISILLLGFGVTNISLGIIAEYLWRTLDVSRKRPVFIIDKIIDLNENNGESTKL